MLRVDVTHNLAQVTAELGEFGRQVPFAAALTMNDTMKDVQKRLRGSTIPKAWTTRNKSFTNAMTTITHRASKRKLTTIMQPAKGRDGRKAGEGFLNRQITGRTKTPKGKHIAIPVIGPGLRRLASGGISKAKRPRNNPKLIRIEKKGGGVILAERQRKKLITRYVMPTKAKGTNRLRRFYPDASDTIERTFPGHWNKRLAQALATASRKGASTGRSRPRVSAAFGNRSL